MAKCCVMCLQLCLLQLFSGVHSRAQSSDNTQAGYCILLCHLRYHDLHDLQSVAHIPFGTIVPHEALQDVVIHNPYQDMHGPHANISYNLLQHAIISWAPGRICS